MPEPIPLFAETVPARPLPVLPEQTFLPDAYRLPDGATRGPTIEAAPRMVYIEVTNRCNLRCETCPRTYFDREPLKTLSYDEFVSIAEQFPALQRCALHGIGEPLLNRDLPRIIAYLKGRGVETLFNSNAALLTPAWQEALVRVLHRRRNARHLRAHPRRGRAAEGAQGAARAGRDKGAAGRGDAGRLDLVGGDRGEHRGAA